MRRRAVVLSALQAGLALALVAAGPVRGFDGGWDGVLGFAAAFAVVGLAPMHLELRRHACTVVLVDAVLVVALFSLGPAAVVVSAALGEAVACCVSRQQPLKLAFNVTSALGAVAVAASAFELLGLADASSPASWLAALVAVACFSATSLASTAVVLARAEGRRIRDVLTASAATAMVASGASASLGLAAVVLLEASHAGPVLLAPLLAAVVVGTRRLARQSAEHLRFERLYQASSRSGILVGFDETLATLAAEARGLVTGSVALCCAARPDGTWEGAIVDDAGDRPAPPEAVAAVVDLARSSGSGAAHDIDALAPAARAAIPSGVRLLVVPALPPCRAEVVLAVAREIVADDQDGARVEVLAAFAGHAALTVANTLLYAEVEEALRRQVDLNRQKGEFVAAVSHELRTPLTSVLASVATVRRLGERLDASRREQLFSSALEQGDRLTRLIEELLLVAAAEHGTMVPVTTPVEVAPLVGGVVADLGPRAPGRFAADVDPGIGALETDEHKVRRVLSNLAENAVKYAPSGPIVVRAERLPTAVRFSVRDHGPGIPAADRERAFERFVQLDQSATRRQGGTGLGLYLCRQLAGLLGATLTLEEPTGGGCLAVFTVPSTSLPAIAEGRPEGRRIDLAEGSGVLTNLGRTR